MTLEPKQTVVIQALTRGATVTDAAKQANVNRATIYLWLKDPTFQAELNRAKQEHVDAMRAALHSLADTAVSTLREMLTGADVPPAVRLKAALAVLQSIGTLEPEQIGETDPEAINERMSMFSGLFLRGAMKDLASIAAQRG